MRVCVWLLAVVVLGLIVCETVEGRRARFKPKPKPKKDKQVEEIIPAKDVDNNQMSGKWFLLSVASRCSYLLETGFKVEATTIVLTGPTSPKAPMSVSTFRKLNFQCWEIKQQYALTNTSGRFLLKGNVPEMNIHITVVDTDYSSYAILLYKRKDSITMKLYGRSTEVPDFIVDQFEATAKKQNLGLDVVFQFPDYGFCASADKEHVLVMT